MACPTCALTAPIRIGTATASEYCCQPVTLLVVTKIAAGINCCPGRNRLRGIELMPQKTNYAADAGRIAELQRDMRSGALSASALVERCLARIDAIDKEAQAWRCVAHDKYL